MKDGELLMCVMCASLVASYVGAHSYSLYMKLVLNVIDDVRCCLLTTLVQYDSITHDLSKSVASYFQQAKHTLTDINSLNMPQN